MSDSSRPHGLQPTRLLHPWDFPGKSTGVGCHCLLQIDLLVDSKADSSGGASGKEPTCQCRRPERCRFDPWTGKIPRERNGNPLQYSCLGNSMDRGAWWDTVHGVAKSHTTELEHKEVKLAANPGLLVSRFVDCNLVLQVSPSYLCRKTSRLSLRFCPVQAEVSRDSGPQQSQSAPCSSETSVI